MKKIFNFMLSFTLFLMLLPGHGVFAAYETPRQDGKARFFYIFGPEGNPLDGKESDEFNLFIDVPENTQQEVLIKVFDPNTAGALDQSEPFWDTEMEFSVSGTEVLDRQTFGYEDTYDNKYFAFGPYAKEKGEKIGNKYRFTLKVKALKGNDLNMFNVSISPDEAEAFSDKFTFVLLPGRGSKMYFYPQIPAGVTKIIARNFDLDADGGKGELYDFMTGRHFKVANSESGKWVDTEINLESGPVRRLEYKVTTLNQINGHAGIQFTDEQGNVLPIYFKKGTPAAPKPKPAPAVAPAPKASLACNQFIFDGRKSHDAETKQLSYHWDFGDGTTSAEPYVSHVYAKGGQYNVTLTVNDNSGLKCEKSVATQSVNVNTPPQAELKGSVLACAGQEVTLDASGSADENSQNLSYRWDLGDGSAAQGAVVQKVYEKGGVYNVSVTVDDNAGSSCSVDTAKHLIKVNTPPVAKAGKPVSVCLRDANQGFNVTFDGSGSYDADRDDTLNYLWDFGDGDQGEGKKVTHEYKEGGNYTAKLMVTDNSGANCSAASDSIPVKLNRAPIATAGRDQFVCSGSKLTFDASGSKADGADVSYVWDFGDGQTGTGKVVEHVYEKGGSYRATLTVDDGNKTDCSTSVDSLDVHVNGAPEAKLNAVEASCTGDKVSFDASSSADPDGDKLKYAWDFGDGTTWEGGSKVSHQYTKGGVYKVTVRVDDGTDASCSSSVDSTTVKVNTPPIANAGPNLTCCTQDASAFDGTGSTDADGDSLAYNWSFGDGQGANEAKTQHAYEKNGNYSVTLTVDDGSGTHCSQSTAGFTAHVNAEPVAVFDIKQK